MIDVECFVKWSTDRSLKNNDDDWTAQKLTKIIKGEPFQYGFYMPCGGSRTYIDQSKANICLSEVISQCARKMRELAPSGCTIVPIPNSGATPQNTEFRTLEHARSVCLLLGQSLYIAKPLLVWSEPQNRAHDRGRSRNHLDHFDKLVLNGSTSHPIILFDDVLTTGSQMYASKRKLEKAGFSVIAMVAVTSVLDKDGATHSSSPGWSTVRRVLI